MRYDAVEFLKLQPIAAPGNYTAVLNVDGEKQSSTFALSINPKESYTSAQLEAKEAFWMELYNTAKVSSEKIQEALTVQKEVLEQADANTALQTQADAVSEVVDAYKSAYIPKGRTLAEIINQPAKIFSKMVWLHNMMELSEGPANQPSLDQFAQLKQDIAAADARYKKDIKAAMNTFDQAAKQ